MQVATATSPASVVGGPTNNSSATNATSNTTTTDPSMSQHILDHPLYPLLQMVFQRCELATSSPRDAQPETICSSESFSEDIKNFISEARLRNLPLTNGVQDVDNFMLKSIEVLRIHLLELEKVHQLCDNFCARYINCLKGKLPIDLVVDDGSSRDTNSTSRNGNQPQDNSGNNNNSSSNNNNNSSSGGGGGNNNSSSHNGQSNNNDNSSSNNGHHTTNNHHNQQQQQQQQNHTNHHNNHSNNHNHHQDALNGYPAAGDAAAAYHHAAAAAAYSSYGAAGYAAGQAQAGAGNPYAAHHYAAAAAGISQQSGAHYTSNQSQQQQQLDHHHNLSASSLKHDQHDNNTSNHHSNNNHHSRELTASLGSSSGSSSIKMEHGGAGSGYGPDSAAHDDVRSPTGSTGSGDGTECEDDDQRGGRGRQQKKRGIFPKAATNIMRAWLFQHLNHPYPSEDQKKQLAEETGLTILQVNNWFINARRRIVQPMIDQSNRTSGNIMAGPAYSPDAGMGYMLDASSQPFRSLPGVDSSGMGPLASHAAMTSAAMGAYSAASAQHLSQYGRSQQQHAAMLGLTTPPTGHTHMMGAHPTLPPHDYGY